MARGASWHQQLKIDFSLYLINAGSFDLILGNVRCRALSAGFFLLMLGGARVMGGPIIMAQAGFFHLFF